MCGMKTLTVSLLAVSAAASAFGVPLVSPDGRVRAEIEPPRISLAYDGVRVAEIEVRGGGKAGEAEREEHRGEWRNAFGERRVVRDDYNALRFSGPDGFEVRCYDAGLCWRGTDDEGTTFAFGGDWRCWPVSHCQGRYEPFRLSDFDRARPMPSWAPVAAGIGEMHNYENIIPGTMEGPFVVEGDGFVAALGEAANTRCAKLRFAKGDAPHTVKVVLEGAFRGEGDEARRRSGAPSMPWRYVRVARDACSLYAGNDLLLNLNAPSRIADTDWIKPGKVLRVAKLDTATGKAAVDFVKANGMQFVELDCGWYGQEHTGDPMKPGLAPERVAKGEKFDLFEILAYARERGVQVILYVNREPLKRVEGGIDAILPTLKGWGVAGVKYGFVNVGSQRWNEWADDAIRKGAEHRLMLDIHDEYRLTGNQRTWPNVMTVEGIHGNEEMPDASHNAALVFTRYLAGPGDYTPCWKIGRVKNSLAHQLALGVATFSPWQFLFWYQRPDQIDASNPALDIWKEMPTVWDETKALAGEIGEYAVVARLAADGRWFVAGLNANRRRTLEVPLDFLAEGEWRMRIVRDADPSATAGLAPAAVETNSVGRASVLSVDAAANGGFAAIVERR